MTQAPHFDTSPQRTSHLDRRSVAAETLAEIYAGLGSTPKRLPCKLFYDAAGSRLFEEITALPEYYPTRTELAILEGHGREMAARIGKDALIVEFGSGASRKTRALLDALETPLVYVPIDISSEMLLSSARSLALAYPGLDVRPVVGDYMHPLELPLSAHEKRRAVTVFFPGSTIGNFEQDEAVSFLRRVRRACGEAARLLIGVDVPKAPELLEAAYDDAAGVTARFNRNALRVINREFGGRFPLDTFRHRAVWNAEFSRIEMHLVSERQQRVVVGQRAYTFDAEEPIVTEHCYKYRPEAFAELVESAGFEVAHVWVDERAAFSVQLLVPA
jgi:dimethylhistidine N-methyltransferase